MKQPRTWDRSSKNPVTKESMIPCLENRAKTYKSKDDMQALLETYGDLAKQDNRPDVLEQVQEALELLSRASSVNSFVESAKDAGL